MENSIRVIFVFSVLLALSCNNQRREDLGISNANTLLLKAQNERLPFENRLLYIRSADSLANKYYDKKIHLKCLKDIATLYLEKGDKDSAQGYFVKTLDLAKILGDKEIVGLSLNNIAVIFTAYAKYDSAEKYYENAQHIFRDLDKQDMLAESLVDIGVLYKKQGEYERAYEVNIEAAKIFETRHLSKNLAIAYTSIGNILKNLNRYDEAMRYHQNSFIIFRQIHDTVNLAYCLNNIANIYRYRKSYDQALSGYFQSLEICKIKNIERLRATVINNVGQTYLELNEIQPAKNYLLVAIDLFRKLDDIDGFLTASNRLASIYIKEDDLPKAKNIASAANTKSPLHGLLKQSMENKELLSVVFQKMGIIDSALKYANISAVLRDSLFNSDMATAIAKMEIKYRTQQKEKQLLLSEDLRKVQKIKIRDQSIFIAIMSFCVMGLIILTILLFRSNKIIKQSKAKIETLMYELNHRVKNNLQIIFDIFNLQKSVISDPKHISMLQSGIDRIKSIHTIHNLLEADGYNKLIDLREFLQQLLTNITDTYSSKANKYNFKIHCDDFDIDIDKAIPVGLILNELITNIFKHAQTSEEHSFVEISCTRTNNECKLKISDNFIPWKLENDTAKRKSGLGIFLIESMVQQLEGDWTFQTNESKNHQIITFKF